MGLLQMTSAAQLGGSVVLALFFLLLARHEPRPYLRDWTAAWIAQAVALGLFLGASWQRWPESHSLYLFLATAHGLLLVSAAWTFAHGTLPMGRRLVFLGVLLGWSALAPRVVPGRALDLVQLAVLASAAVGAASLMWRASSVGDMGVRIACYVLVLIGAVHVLVGVAEMEGHRHDSVALFEQLTPLLLLFLQMLLGLSLVLGVMEKAHWALAAAHGQLQDAQRQLRVFAETDPLTGVANRRVFRELVDELRSGRGADHGSVLLVDMDGLKVLNDTQGHAAGDAAIRRLSEAIRTRTRMTDLVVRWGGDEFVVVLPGAALADARIRRDAMAEAIDKEGLSASIGCAAWDAGTDVMAAVQVADEDMYREKSARRKARATA